MPLHAKLSLDDPISKYVDRTPNEWKEVTIRHLLTHTSGIPDFLNENVPFHSWRLGFDQRVHQAVACLSIGPVPNCVRCLFRARLAIHDISHTFNTTEKQIIHIADISIVK